ncbi:MAG: nitrogenase component 1 [Peptococcaceae bacterium]|jgi:nitrogenase molybdenum-iron protein alpha/beta subunit|nr:nitrogenase component 1 [Peptococcaceae bacterium]
MAKLCVYLPPFAPDYSGVCSALFEMNALIMIHDASGCTGNYTGFDEPRWYGSVKQIYCSGLRKNDAISGGESKFIDRIRKALTDNPEPDFIAIVGSPVPMVIGTDFVGLAQEVQSATGVTTFGFPTNGTKYYTDGYFLALKKLIDRYAEPYPCQPGVVNILGATPLDFWQDEYKRLIGAVAADGSTVNFTLTGEIAQIRKIAGAALNYAVSESGLMVARYLHERFGTPYKAEIPGFLFDERFVGTNALIIADRVKAHEIRRATGSNATIAVVFNNSVPGSQFAGDIYLPDEAAVIKEVNSPKYDTIIADPLICALVRDANKTLIPVGHYAVSGKQGQKTIKSEVNQK